MKNPCKKCLIKPCCKVPCEEAKYYFKNTVPVISFIGIILVVCILLYTLFILLKINDNMLNIYIWGTCWIISLIILSKFKIKANAFLILPFISPFVLLLLICYIFLKFTLYKDLVVKED